MIDYIVAPDLIYVDAVTITGGYMKRLSVLLIGVTLVLPGCFIVPEHDRGEHRGYEERDHHDRGDNDDRRGREEHGDHDRHGD
jgi:hypothetical protein